MSSSSVPWMMKVMVSYLVDNQKVRMTHWIGFGGLEATWITTPLPFTVWGSFLLSQRCNAIFEG